MVNTSPVDEAGLPHCLGIVTEELCIGCFCIDSGVFFFTGFTSEGFSHSVCCNAIDDMWCMVWVFSEDKMAFFIGVL